MDKYSELLEKIDSYELMCLAKTTYGPYERPDGRSIVIIRDNNESRTMSYPRYIMEKHLNRSLDPETETVDHIDRNHKNNDINNLRLVPRAEHSSDDTRRVKLVKFECPICHKEFERSPRLIRDKSRKGASGPFCSRECSGRYSRQVQLKQIDKSPPQAYLESEYYRKDKNVVALELYFTAKYGV